MPKTEDAELTAADLLDIDQGDAPAVPSLEAALDAAELAGADIDDLDHPLLSRDEVRAARAKAVAKYTADQKKLALEALVERELQKLRGPAGLVTGDAVKDEMVKFTIDLPEFAPYVSINGRPYFHSFTYDVPRHVADTLRNQCALAHNHQLEIDGKGLTEKMRRPQEPVRLSANTLAVTR